MATPLLTIILTVTILEDVNSIPLPDIQDWSKFHIDIFNFDIENNFTYSYKILKHGRNFAGLCYGNTPVIDSGIEYSLYHSDLPTLTHVYRKYESPPS